MKLTLPSIGVISSASSTITEAFNAIEEAFENTLSRDGTSPNELNDSLDVNSQRVYNLPESSSPTDAVRRSELDIYDTFTEKFDLTSLENNDVLVYSSSEEKFLPQPSSAKLDIAALLGIANGCASLNSEELVIQDPASKGQPNGVAGLDGEGRSTAPSAFSQHIFDYIPAGQHAAIIAGTSEYDAADDLDDALTEGKAAGRMPLWLPQGTLLLGRMWEPSSHPINLIGAGRGRTILKGVHADEAIIKINPTVTYDSEGMRFIGVSIKGDTAGPPDHQHGILIAKRWHRFLALDVSFHDLTGIGLALDPGTSGNPCYCQNASLRDVSFYNVGGCYGLSREPQNGQAHLSSTLLRLENINLDQGINPQSPNFALWDFRTTREITAHNFLNEGVGASGCDVVCAFGTNGFNKFTNSHTEFTTDPPTYHAFFYGDPNSRFYSDSDSYTEFEGLVASAKIGFDASVESRCSVRRWFYYDADSIDDLASFTDLTGSLDISELASKVMFSVPHALAGQVHIASSKSSDVYMAPLAKGPMVLARWRPSSGVPGAFNTRYLSATYGSGTTGAVEADPDDARLAVLHVSRAAGNMPSVSWAINLPAEWLTDGAGPVVTMVMRYRIDMDAADISAGVIASALSISSSIAVTSPATRVSFDNAGFDGKYHTAVCSWRPNAASVTIGAARVGTNTQPIELRIAALDLYLGDSWNEPLDLEYP